MIFFALIIFYMNLIVAQSSAICDGSSTYENIKDLLNGASNCTFPYYEITSDFVRDGCPQLTTESLCPFNADKSLNKINIEKTVEIVKNCLKQELFVMNSTTIPWVTYSVDEILQGFGLTGECTVPQNSGFISNVNNTLITVTDVQDTVKISVNGIDLICDGVIDFTSGIVRDGCPQLTTESLCPFNADKSLNKVNIEKTVKIVNECLKKSTIGDIPMNPIMFPVVTYSANDIIQAFGLKGECYVPPNISFVYNVNNTLITVTDVQDTVKFSINVPNIIYQGTIDCKFTIPLIKPITMNNVGYHGIVAFTSKSSISLNDNNPVPEIESPTASVTIQYDFLNLKILNNIPIGTLFSKFFQQIINQTNMSELFGKFIAAIVSGALEITKTQFTSDIVRDGCPQLTTESLCPFNADKSLNKINIEKTVKIVKTCLNQPKFVDIDINPIMFPPVTYSVNQILQGFGLTGECVATPNINFIYNVNDTQITVTDVQDTVNISIAAPKLIYQGAISCKFTIPFIKTPITMDNISYYGILSLTSKSSISLNDNNPVPEIQSSTATFDVQLNFLKLPILGDIQLGSIFSIFYQQNVSKSKVSELFGKFIAAFVSGALEITKTRCN
ncbi:hypothetical protein CHUAL_006695 [Chamberlinius hualienensis]